MFVHVVPMDDIGDHTLIKDECECCPRVEQMDNGIVVIHAAYDGRETYEGIVARGQWGVIVE